MKRLAWITHFSFFVSLAISLFFAGYYNGMHYGLELESDFKIMGSTNLERLVVSYLQIVVAVATMYFAYNLGKRVFWPVRLLIVFFASGIIGFAFRHIIVQKFSFFYADEVVMAPVLFGWWLDFICLAATVSIAFPFLHSIIADARRSHKTGTAEN